MTEPEQPPRVSRYSLTADLAELAELERIDPAVAAAAVSYDAMVERLTYGPRQCRTADLSGGLRRRCVRDKHYDGDHDWGTG